VKLRTDPEIWPHDAGRKRAVLLGAVPNPLDDLETNWSEDWLAFVRADGGEAAPGDVWEISINPDNDRQHSCVPHEGWTVVGYTLWCPNEACPFGTHEWTHAHDCKPYDGVPCKNGGPSCWTWTGSPLDGTLTASPSLYSPRDIGGCGWHGHLNAGELTGKVE